MTFFVHFGFYETASVQSFPRAENSIVRSTFMIRVSDSFVSGEISLEYDRANDGTI